MESSNGFRRLISVLPRSFRVLDVGAGGLQGINTTNFLLEHFGVKNVLGVCTPEKEVNYYYAQRTEKGLPKANIQVSDFYEMQFPQKFDLVVVDMNVENNVIHDWSEEGLARARELLKDGGYLIQYVMLTDQYGDPNKTPELIRTRWIEFWETENLTLQSIGERLQRLNGWEVFAYEVEERRPYILWMMLRKTA